MKRVWLVIGCLVSAIGAGALIEAHRLQPYQAAFGFGAGTFPLMLGVLLVGTGAYLALTAVRTAATRVSWPRGTDALALVATFATLIFYGVAITLLGYYAASFLASAALFRIIGRYSWSRSVAGAAVTTIVLAIVFRFVASTPLPTGLVG